MSRKNNTRLADLQAQQPAGVPLKYGRLTPISEASSIWTCLCDCGAVLVSPRNPILRGRTTSCGCARRDRTAEMGRSNTTQTIAALQAKQPGIPLKFGRLTPLEERPRYRWLCRCDCGTVKEVLRQSVCSGATVSCGCYHRERLAEVGRLTFTTHGKSGTPEHRTWASMLSRCSCPTHHARHRYSERGIRVCERWAASFEAFFADMGLRPSADLSIDRIDNNKGYDCGNRELCQDCRERAAEPNCRWATMKEQGLNKSTNVTLTHAGKTMTVSEWEKAAGMKTGTIAARIRRGWPEDEAITKPPRNWGR